MDSSTGVFVEHADTGMRPIIQIEETYAPEDDWTGIANPRDRRKLQNRLNQRLYRRRHGLDIPKPRKKRDPRKPGLNLDDQVVPSSSSAGNYSSTVDSSHCLSDAVLAPNETVQASTQVQTLKHATMCKLSPYQKRLLIADFQERLDRSSVAASPRLDMLLTLVHFNVFRALVSNSFSIGFDMAWLSVDAISPFYTSQNDWSAASCPLHLLPTMLQQKVEHHPWIDLFPFPAMRDNLLIADGEYDEDQLCIDLVEFCHVPCEQTGLIVWGEPGDPKGWEVSESFMKKWSRVLKGSYEIHESTNYWRERRGEEGLAWEV